MTRIISENRGDVTDTTERLVDPATGHPTVACEGRDIAVSAEVAQKSPSRAGGMHPVDETPSVAETASERVQQYYLGLSRQLATLIGMGRDDAVAVGLTSATRQEGVTSVAVNVAAAGSRDLNGRVLLVDANFDQPHAAVVAGAVHGEGLADLLIRGEIGLRDVVQASSLPSLDVLAAGSAAARQQLSSGSARLRGLLREMRHGYQMVIFDLPPATELTACLPLASCLDGVVLVVEAERTRSKTVTRAKQRLAQCGAEVLGAVFNKRREYVPRWMYDRI